MANATMSVRSVDETDIEAFHDRHSDLDYSVLEELDEFTHRGEQVETDQLISTLACAIEMASVSEGEDSTPATLSEFETVDVVLDKLKAMHLPWFGDTPQSPEKQSKPRSTMHLSQTTLKERYYREDLDPATEPVEGDSLEDQKRVVIPLVVITLDEVSKQMEADREATIEAGKEQIKQAVAKEAYKHDLGEEAIEEAVASAKEILEGR